MRPCRWAYPVSARSMSRQRSSTSSIPADRRRRSGGQGEPGPSIEARCSISDSTPPSEVARFHSLTRAAVGDRGVLAAADADRQHAAESAAASAGARVRGRDDAAVRDRAPRRQRRGWRGGSRARSHWRRRRARAGRACACRASAGRPRTDARIRPCVLPYGAHALAQRVVAGEGQRAGDDVGMAIQIFGRRMHDDVGAERERRVNTGVAQVESTASAAPAACAIRAAPAMSLTPQSGLLGVSSQISFVAPGLHRAREVGEILGVDRNRPRGRAAGASLASQLRRPSTSPAARRHARPGRGRETARSPPTCPSRTASVVGGAFERADHRLGLAHRRIVGPAVDVAAANTGCPGRE